MIYIFLTINRTYVQKGELNLKGSVDKRKDSWRYRVDIGLDPVTGKRKQKSKSGFKTKKEAQIALAEFIASYENGEYFECEKISLREYLNYWLETYAKTNVSPSSYIRYTQFANQIVSKLGGLELSSIKPMHIQKFYTDLQKTNLSNSTILKVHRMLSMSLKHAVGWQMLNYNPASAVKPPRPQHVEMSIWDSDTINQVLKDLKESNSNLYIPILIGATTGMRQGEIAALRWQDVDFVNGFISVRYNFQKIDNSNNYALASPKTSKSNRSIAMMDLTIKELKEHRKKQNELIMLNRDIYNNQDFVCAFEDGTPYKPVYIGELFRKFMRRSNYPKIRFHDLRHSHATMLLKQGVNPKIVSERLGHANISITLDTYSHVLPNMQREAIARLNEMF